jgi:hypothetical protein
MKRTPPRLIGMVIALAALFAAPASAQAAFSVTGSAAPTSTAAGAHSDFQIHLGFSGGQVKDLTVGLPPGVIGNPNATPKCTVAQLNADSCPANTIVGSVTANATVTVVVVPVTVNVNGDLYNLTPQPGEPARFGIVLRPLSLPAPLPSVLPPIILQSGVQLRPDYGLDTVINNIPNTTLSSGDTVINSQDITLFGSRPWMSTPFMRNPTSCDQKTTNFSATPYSGSADTAQANFTATNCGALDFSPTLTARVGGPGQNASGVPTTVITSIDQDTDEAGLIKAEVTVPPDFNPNAAILFNTCSQLDFQAGNCPPSSVVGSAVASSPLLSSPLTGPVELVASGGQFPNIGLDLQGQLHLLLQGTLDITKKTTFDNLPDIPIAHFALTFASSPGLLGTSRDLCVGAPPVFHADFHGYNGASTTADSPATVEGPCGPSAPVKSKKKCKKHKKKKHRAAEAKKKKCKKRKKRR